MLEGVKELLTHLDFTISPICSAGVLYYMIVLQVKIARMADKIQLYQDNIQDISRQMHGVIKFIHKYSALSEQVRGMHTRLDKVERDIEHIRNGADKKS